MSATTVGRIPATLNPTVNVIGSFNGGGSGGGTQNDHQNHYELQNYTSLIHGNHISSSADASAPPMIRTITLRI